MMMFAVQILISELCNANYVKGRHAHIVKPYLSKWASSSCDSRRKEVLLARLRLGHTRITHAHLFTSDPPPLCSNCRIPLTVEHILIQCPDYNSKRYHLLEFTRSHNLQLNLETLLGNDYDALLDLLFEFLISTNLFYAF